MKTKIYVMSSTHWDREWVHSFEKFRFRLVRMIDNLIKGLEDNPDYKSFHFDGQTIMVEDYLEMRPQNRDRLLKLIRDKRILIGPFNNMPDCLLPSGEALAHNLQEGLCDCEKYGAEPHSCGYTADVFGHNAQMPQIYKNFNIDNCLLFRGRSGYEKNAFIWEGADGTEVLVHKVHPDFTYGSFYLAIRWPLEEDKDFDWDKLLLNTKKYLDREKQYFCGDFHLMIDGIDNLDSNPLLPKLLEYLNANLPDFEFVISDLTDYTERIREIKDKLEVVKGIIYDIAVDGQSNMVLKNVTSSMVHIKQDNMFCENFLSFVCEPLDFYTELNRDKFPEFNNYKPNLPRSDFFDYAWKKVVINQPHDTLGGTSRTQTHEDTINLYKRAKENIKVTLYDCLDEMALNVSKSGKGADGAFLVFNPSEVDIDGVTELDFPVRKDTGHQGSFIFYDEEGQEITFNITEQRSELHKTSEYGKLHKYIGYDYFRTAMDLKLPAYSYKVITYDFLKAVPVTGERNWLLARHDHIKKDYSSMRIAENSFDNGVMVVTVNPNGSLRVEDKRTGKEYDDMLLFQDSADMGEGWNHKYAKFDRIYNTQCSDASVSVLYDTANIAKINITHYMRLPKSSDAEGLRRNAETSEFIIETTVVIYKNSRRIDFETTVDNKIENHRLRVLFPTFINTDTFKTMEPFDMQEWQISKQVDPSAYETEPFTVPNQGGLLIRDGGDCFSLYTKGLYEAEVTNRPDKAVCLTLFRSFPNECFTEKSDMGRMIRKMKFEYAIDLSENDEVSCVRKSHAYKNGLHTVTVGECSGSLKESGFIVKNTGGALLSALKFKDKITGKPVVRIYDVMDGSSGELIFEKPLKSAKCVKLNGEITGEAVINEGKLVYNLKKKEIGSFQLEF